MQTYEEGLLLAQIGHDPELLKRSAFDRIVLKKSSADRQYVITLRRGVELEDGLS
jgi:hypothetical protein